MLAAVAAALGVRRDLGITGVATEAQVDRAIASRGFALRADRPYKGRIQGRFFRGTVCVRAGLRAPQRRVVKGHELGHALLGHDEAGAFYRHDPVGQARMGVELQAQVFAWILHVGRPAGTLRGLTRQLVMGHEAGLPLDFCCAAVSALAARRQRPLG